MARALRQTLAGRYAVAFLFTAMAIVARWLVDPVLGPRSPYTLFFAAVAASAWFGGLGPGLLTLLIGAAYSFSRFVAPLMLTEEELGIRLVGLAIFLATGTLVALIGEAQRRARQVAEDRAADLVKLREAEREAYRSKDESLALLDSMLGHAPVGFAFFDRDHRYVRINDHLAAINGLPAADHLGRTVAEVIPIKAPVVDPILDRIFADGEPIRDLEVEGETPAAPGVRRHWLCGLYPVRTHDGRIPWVGAVVTEITDRKRAEVALRDSFAAAESANRAKDQFLAMLSHELRTPLTPVLAEVSAMLDDPETAAEFRPVLESTRRNIQLESRLIDDLLDVTRIGKGKLPLSREPVNAHLLVHRTLEICRGDVEAAGLKLVVDLRAARAFVDADPPRLQQVFWNLIKNAVKFTPQGGTVSVRSRNEAGGDRLIVQVEDSGIGIEPEVLPRIFDAFEQGGQAVTQRFGGLGLGLAISRSLIALHGGRLWARSAGRGRGATFVVELDTLLAPSSRDEPNGAGHDGHDGRSLRVLLVEDNTETLQVMSRLLRKSGHEVATASTMESALALAVPGNPRFDVVVSDLGLPDGSGLDLMRRLGGRASVRGVALSGFGTEADLRESLEAGFDVHLTKPVDFGSLQRAIRLVTTPRDGG